MNEFFKLYTYTPWDGLSTKELVEVKVLSIKNIFNSFPIIEKEFFGDLLLNLTNYRNYSWFETIRRVVGPNKEDYDIKDWRFIWAIDNDNRMYQILLQKLEEKEKISQSVLAAVAPPELVQLLSEYDKKAIQKILSLLNDPSQMKFLIYLTPKGKSIAEEYDLLKLNKAQLQQFDFLKSMVNKPNIAGQWFPTSQIICPKCNENITNLINYNLGSETLTCPRCSYIFKK
jgi:hypothetical protein